MRFEDYIKYIADNRIEFNKIKLGNWLHKDLGTKCGITNNNTDTGSMEVDIELCLNYLTQLDKYRKTEAEFRTA